MDKKKSVLITGASGFIGGYLVKEALRRGYEVWAGVRANSSRTSLQDPRIHLIDLHYDSKVALVEQFREIVATVGAWHYVIHNAGITKAHQDGDFYRINAHYTYIIIEALAEAGCIPEKFLLMSSLSSFGPVNETSFKPIRIEDKQVPNSAYGRSKLEAELFVKAQTYFPYIILLPTGVYGPGDKDYLLEIKSVQSGFDFKMGLKPQQITFIYVKDLAVAVWMALENENLLNKSYFVADGDVYSDAEFSRLVRKLLGKRFTLNIRIPFWICFLTCFFSETIGRISGKTKTLNLDKYKIMKQRNWICDTEPLRRELGFESAYPLKEGLKETIQFARENGLLAKNNTTK